MYRIFTAFLIGLAFTGRAPAQDLDARGLARVIAPHVNDTTQLVGHVNVQKLNLKKYFEVMSALMADKNKEITAARNFALVQQEKLLEAGVRHVLAVVNAGDLSGRTPPEVVLLAPLGNKAEVDDLLKLIEQVPGMTAKVENNTLIARFGAMAAGQPKERLEFAEALEALKDMHIQFIASPSADVRRLLEQQLPAVPGAVGREEVVLLTKGIRWLAVGYETSALTQQYLVQARDAKTAKELNALLDKGLAALQKVPDAPADFAKVRELLGIKQLGDRLSMEINEKVLIALLQPAVAKVRLAAARTQSMNNLKQIALAMHVHHDTHRTFPARASFDANGTPLLSWRVHILPYIDQQELYKQFKLDEPWDGPNNKKLISRMPQFYASPLNKTGQEGKTTYLAVTGKGSIFEGEKGVRLADVTDGTSNTILVVEANDGKAVFWTQPEDFPIDAKDPVTGLANKEIKGFLTALADGSVRFLSATIRPATLTGLFTRNGGEVVNPDD